MKATRAVEVKSSYEVSSSDIARAKAWLHGQGDRLDGKACLENNGSYLDGWYAPEATCPPMLTMAEFTEAKRKGLL